MTDNGSKASAEAKRGFTLIEVLTVVAIISLLIAAIIVVTGGAPDKARRTGTQGMINELEMALGRYYNEFKLYPPDGYDEAVSAPNGQQLKGSACLTYYLAWMYPDGSGGFTSFDLKKPDYTDSDNIRMVEVHGNQPFWEGVRENKDLNRHGEILDKWGRVLRYDNCYRTKEDVVLYTPNIQPMDGGSDPDPREMLNNKKAFNQGSYDLWSSGSDGDSDESSADDDIIRGRVDSR